MMMKTKEKEGKRKEKTSNPPHEHRCTEHNANYE